MSSRRKSIGRGDEATGPVMSQAASASMRRGEKIHSVHHHGTPHEGMYSRKLDGEYGASVQDLQGK